MKDYPPAKRLKKAFNYVEGALFCLHFLFCFNFLSISCRRSARWFKVDNGIDEEAQIQLQGLYKR